MQRDAKPSQMATRLSFKGSALWTASWGLSVSPHRKVSEPGTKTTWSPPQLHKDSHSLQIRSRLPPKNKKRKGPPPASASLILPTNTESQWTPRPHPDYCGLTCGDRQSAYVNFRGAECNLPGTPPPASRAGDSPIFDSQKLSALF